MRFSADIQRVILECCMGCDMEFLVAAANEYVKQLGKGGIELEVGQIVSHDMLARLVYSAVIKTGLYDRSKKAYRVDARGFYRIKIND